MSDLEKIAVLESKLYEKQVELNIADEMHYDEIKGYKFYNGLLTCLVISLSIWIATA